MEMDYKGDQHNTSRPLYLIDNNKERAPNTEISLPNLDGILLLMLLPTNIILLRLQQWSHP
jgi:hypothetical protein